MNDEPAAEKKRQVFMPNMGDSITSLRTGNTYTIGEPLGEGAFGKVFNGTDSWDNELAIKVLKPTGGSYEEVRSAAAAEFARLLTLRHPNITYVHDAFEYRDTFYIVTERCHFSLTELFRLRTFDPTLWLLPIARCVLQAVEYLHLNGYAHQDIHPSNVFGAFARDELGSTPETAPVVFKVGDLGVSAALSEISAENKRAMWMVPPEVLEESEFGPIDHRQDIYHVGLVLLQLASGKLLKWTDQERLDGKPRDAALGLPPPLNFALEKALRRHVYYRTASAMELWRDLRSLES